MNSRDTFLSYDDFQSSIPIIFYKMFVAYVVVLVPSIVVDILYIIASVIRGHIDFFNEMPTWHSIIVRLAVEYQAIGNIIYIKETAACGLVVWLNKFAV